MPDLKRSRNCAGNARVGILLCLCLGAIAAIVVVLFLRGKAPKSVVLPERLSSELALHDGRLYVTNQPEPFNGLMLEKYPNGTLKSRSTVLNGQLNGVSEGWHTNGQMQVREIFTNGVSNGVREKWYENGARLSEGEIVLGKHEGVFRRWHENGKLAEEVAMHQGNPEGLSSSFYPSGYLKSQATVKEGKVVEQKAWKDGEVMLGGATNAPAGQKSAN